MDSAAKRIAADAARLEAPIDSLVFELHVLCPSFPEPLIVRNVTTTATIGELRLRIQRLLLSLSIRWITAAGVRMRLIYRGRLLTDDAATMLAVFGEQQMRSSTQHTVHLAIYAPDAAIAQPADTPATAPATTSSPSPASAPAPAPAVRSSPMLTEAEMQRRIHAHFNQRSLTPQHIPAPPSRPAPGPVPPAAASAAAPGEHRAQEAVNIIASAMQRSLSGIGPLPSYPNPNPSAQQQQTPEQPLFAHTPFRIHTPQLTDAVAQPTPKMYVLQAPDGRAHGIIVDTSNIKMPVPFIQPSTHVHTHAQPPIPTPTTPAFFAATATAAAAAAAQNPAANNNPNVPANNVNVAVRINAIALDPENPDRPLWQQFLRLLWSEVWFILRLIIFVWWFAGGTNDPFRWAGALSLAAVFIALNVGLFEDFGRLFRANIIGGLMPRIDAHGRPAAPADAGPAAAAAAPAVAAAAAPANANANANAAVPGNPQVLANRLFRRAQQNQATWLLNLARSLERGFMMFMASLAPGLAEGHIANVEAAEEQRRQAERRRAEEEEEEQAKKRQEEEEKKKKEKEKEEEKGQEEKIDADAKEKEVLPVASGEETAVSSGAAAAAADVVD